MDSDIKMERPCAPGVPQVFLTVTNIHSIALGILAIHEYTTQ